MIVGSVFSGVGGLDLGLARAGLEHAFFAETDPWRRDVLAAHWPGTRTYADVRHVATDDGRYLGEPARGGAGDAVPPAAHARRREAGAGLPVDLLAGGFPCQDVSTAGRRAGLAGARSGLFHEYVRIADALRPAWLLIENVPGLLTSNDGRDFGVVVGTLAELGYGVAWRVLDARYFGVAQRRRRVFVVGRAGGDAASALRALCESCDGDPTPRSCTWTHPAARPRSSTTEPRDIAPALVKRYGKGTDSDATDALIVVANTLKGQRGKAGGGLGPEETLVVAPTIARTLTTNERWDGDTETFVVAPAIAAPLTKGSATGPGVNAPGRRQEDDVNLVAFHPTAGGAKSLSPTNNATPGVGTGAGGTVAIAHAAGVRRLTPTECERLMSWPDGWTAPEGLHSPNSRRYAACGDGVVSNVAEWIARGILAEAAQ